MHRKDGSWAAISTTLKRTADGGLAPAAALSDVVISNGGDGPFVTWRSGGSVFTLAWPAKLPVPRVDGSTAVYDNVLPDVNLHVTALPDGFQHTLEVKNAAAAANPQLRQISYAMGGTATRTVSATGALTLTDAGGAPFATTAGASMWDSTRTAPVAAAPAAMARSLTATVSTISDASDATAAGPAAQASPLTVNTSGSTLKVTPDLNLLNGSSTVYPVYIDPVFNGQSTKWAYANSANKDWDVGNRALVGRNPYDGVLYRSFFQFDISALHAVAGTKVLSAEVDMVLDHSWSCDATWVHLYRTGTVTVASGNRMSWSTRPLPSGVKIDAWAGHANEASGCNGKIEADMPAIFDGAGVASDVQTVAASSTAYTVGICACNESGDYESAEDRWKKFFTGKTYLKVTYDKQPNVPAPQAFSATTDCYKACSSPAVIRNSQPTLRAAVSDPFGGNLKVTYEVRTAATETATIVATNASAPQVKASGDTAAWPVSAALADGSTYYWRVKAMDEAKLSSSWSSWQTLKIDKTAPALPSVSSTEYPFKAWGALVGTPGQFNFTDTSTDTTEFTWSIDGGTAAKSTTTGTPPTGSATYTPTTDLVHVLQVKATDVAGNISANVDHQFWVDSPASRCSYWKLDQTSGTSVLDSGPPECSPDDSTVTGVTGTVSGTATFGAGYSDNGLFFAAPGGALTMPGPVVDTNGSFTVTAWVEPTDLSQGNQTVISQDGTTASRFQVRYDAAANAGKGGWCFLMRATDSADPATQVCATGTIPDDTGVTHEPRGGAWVHLAAVYNAPANTMQLHVMGNPTSCSGEMVQTSFTGSWSTTGALTIGRAKSGEAWIGGVDEVRAYPIALSTTKICQLATS
ncbi:hypothetical protein BJY16_001818 [Actinoplanes octamycinicus]|uniref:LamG-like jellyroll fold domain-containing protein n=1 Tax=Actinoplanes octamycinicus TaxID=135948 RepID=A0A7W7GU37_9ACTN|nr:LamG domain-containing protein [Actinoplanes octamycinicus]MBB4738359.1 hypothetical protein [Actinoplanes octamycinicus]